MTRKQLWTSLLGIAALVAVMISTVAAFDNSLPGRSADSELLASIRARAYGPCQVGTTNCTATGITCTVSGGVCADSTSACDSCTGTPNETCQNTNKVACTVTTVTCCDTGKTCDLVNNINNPCQCKTGTTSGAIGSRTDCTP
jgi:hypothetical protein